MRMRIVWLAQLHTNPPPGERSRHTRLCAWQGVFETKPTRSEVREASMDTKALPWKQWAKSKLKGRSVYVLVKVPYLRNYGFIGNE